MDEDRPSVAELTPDIPMWISLRVCECGRVGEYARTRCGADGRHNMAASCPTIAVAYVPDGEE